MAKTLTLEIAYAFSQALKLPVDYHQLRNRVGEQDPPPGYAPHSLFDHLVDIGHAASMSFLHSRISAEQLQDLAEQSALPILVFLGRTGELQPILLTEYRRGKIKYLEFDTGGAPASQEEELETLLPRLVQTNIALDGSQGPSNDPRPILMFNAVAVDSLLSYSGEVQPGEYSPYTPLKRLWYLLVSERRDITYIYVYALIVGLLSLTLPVGIQALVGLVSGGLILESVVILILFIIVGTGLSGALQLMQISIVEVLQQRVFARLSFELAFRIPRVRMEAIRQYYAPELMNRFFDIINIQKGLSKLLTDFVTAVLQLLFGFVLLAFYHPLFIFFSVVILALIVAVFLITGSRGIRTSLDESKYKYKVAHWLEEVARTMSTFKLAGHTNLAVSRMDNFVTGYLKKRKAHFRILMGQYITIVVFKTLITGGLLILGVILVEQRQITLGQFVASELVVVTVLTAVEKIILTLEVVYDTLTAVEKVGSVTDLPLDRSQGYQLDTARAPKGFGIELRDVCYRYPDGDKDVLRNINLRIEPGERMGVIGPIGSGKTTLMSVMTGLLHNYTGIITYDGLALRDYNITFLRDRIGDNLNHGDIFDGTVFENVTMGKPEISVTAVQYALELVELLPWAQNLPNGLHSLLIASGQQLPESYRKKLILARSLAVEPRLMVFDDFFYSIEGGRKNRIMEHLTDRDQPWTLVAVTNDPNTLSQMDRIAIFDDGQIQKVLTYDRLCQDAGYCDLIYGGPPKQS